MVNVRMCIYLWCIFCCFDFPYHYRSTLNIPCLGVKEGKMTQNEYKKRIRNYLQSPESTDKVWEYVLESLLDVAATMGLDFLDEQILSEQELRDR